MKMVGLRAAHDRQNGFALVTAMIFLILLTLVALIAIRGTGLELKVSGNSVLRTQAFEASEAGRTDIDSVLQAHVDSRGWPSGYQGCPAAPIPTAAAMYCVPASIFGTSPPSSISVRQVSAGGLSLPDTWYDHNDATNEVTFNPAALTTDAFVNQTIAGTTTATNFSLLANVAVYRMQTTPATGHGLAQVAGYEGGAQGGSAGGGGNIYFYLQSRGQDPKQSGAEYNTSTAFRYVIHN